MWKLSIFRQIGRTEPSAELTEIRPIRFGQKRPKVRPNRSVRSYTSNTYIIVVWFLLQNLNLILQFKYLASALKLLLFLLKAIIELTFMIISSSVHSENGIEITSVVIICKLVRNGFERRNKFTKHTCMSTGPQRSNFSHALWKKLKKNFQPQQKMWFSSCLKNLHNLKRDCF